MALSDPENDPAVAEALYGEVAPSVAQPDPVSSPSPWDWVPDHWGTDNAPPDGAQIGPSPVGDTSGSIPGGAAEFAMPTEAPPPADADPPPPVTPSVMMDPTPEALPPDALGPQMPQQAPPPSPLEGSFFDPGAGAPPPSIAPAPTNPADAAGAGLPPLPEEAPPPPIPYGAAPTQAPTAGPGPGPELGPPPAPAPGAFGPQLPQQPAPPIRTPYGWDPLSGTEFETKHINPNAEDPFAGVTAAAGYSDVERLAAEHPEVLAQMGLEQAKRKQIAESAARIHADEEDVRQLKQNLANRQEADARTQKQSDQIMADAQKLAHTPLDNRRWFRNKSLFGKLTTIFAAIVGGLATRPGGPNIGLDFVNKQMDDDIAEQKYDIENQRGGIAARQGAVAQEFARTGNLFQAAETVRQATRQASINKLQTDQQNFDPQGTSYLEYGKLIQGQRGAMAKLQEDTRKTSFDENLKVIKAQQEAEHEAEIRRANMAKEALERTKDARAGVGKEKETSYSPEQLKILNPSATTVPPISMTQTEFAKWQGAQKGGEELATAKRANDPETLARAQQVPGIITETGKPVSFLPDEVKDIKKAMFNATELNRMNDELVGLIEKHGFDPGWTKSDSYQRAQQVFSSMVLLSKEQDHLGALSGGDVEIEHKKIGTDDPNQLRDTIGGIRSFRHQTTEGINSLVQTHAIVPPGEHIKRWDPPPLITSTPDSAKLTGKTLAEHVDEAKPGKITKALTLPGISEVTSLLPGYAKPDDYQRNAANTPTGPTGLALEDTAKVGGAIQSYDTAPPKAQDAIVDQLKVWASGDRPSITTGVLGLIQGENPALYERVLSKLPADVQKQRREFDAARAQFPGANLPPPPAPKRKADSPKDDE